MADITRRIPGGDCEGGGGERGERGKRGKRGHRGHQGPPGGQPLSAFFPFEIVTTTIYARVTGSDEHGKGTLDDPFRTFQRAIAQVAVDTGGVIANGKRFVVDITGIGIETLPDGYEMPALISTTFLSGVADPAELPFRFNAPVDIRAFPQPLSSIPLAETSIPAGDIASITADPATGLVTITVTTPRSSWAADALRGAFIVGDTTTGISNAAIVSSTPTTIFVAHILAGMPVQNFSIVEPSATLQSNAPSVEGGALNCFNTPAVAFHGLRLRCLDPNGVGLALGNAPQPIMELCDVEGLISNAILEQFLVQACVLRDKGLDIESSSFTVRQSLITNIPFTTFFVTFAQFARSVADGMGGSFGAGPVFIGPGGGAGQRWEVFNFLLTGTTVDPAFNVSAGNSFSFADVQIDGTAGDAIFASGPTQAFLTHVSGSGNTGFGVRTDDGAHVQVDATTTIGNADGRAYENGNNAPVAAWPGVSFNDTDPTTFSRVFEP